eukprot:g6271.t1
MGDGTVPGATLQALVDDAIARRAAALVVPPAEYDFTIAGGPSSLVIDSGAGLSIDGSGSTLWFSTGGGTLLTKCSRVELSAFTIDYTPTLAQGTIVSVQRNATPPSFVADFDARFLVPGQFQPGAKMKVALFDPTTKQMLRQAAQPAAINIFTDSSGIAPVARPTNTSAPAPPLRYRVSVHGNLRNGWQRARPGLPVLVFPRGGPHALATLHSTACRFTDVAIFGAASMGVVESGGGGGHVYTRLVLDRRPLQRAAANMSELLPASARPFRYLASNADGFHSTTNDFAPSIIDSRISWTGDDLANICSAMSVALGPIGTGGAGGKLAMVDTGGNLLRASPGDTLSFYHLGTLQRQGSATIVHAEQTRDPAAVQAMRAAYATMQAAPYNAGFVTSLQGHFAAGFPVALTLQGGIPPFVARYSSLAILESTDNSNALVRNVTLSDGYARAFMIKGRDARFENSTFRRAGGLWVGPEQPWLEGDPGMRNVTIEWNVFDSVGDPAINARSDFNESGRSIVVRNNTNVAQMPRTPVAV